RAPRAEVAILGYPWIVPEETGCFDRMPIAEGDVPYLRNIQRVLNVAVERAADTTSSTYVDLGRASDGHDACQDPGVRWIEPVLQGTNPVVVHPNALGERRMARRTIRVLDLPVTAGGGPLLP
ncbi:MAG TPA: SGNH/GDSL hydrolase family protein, partial [Actinomycetota bacterium]|nr:SGNH/GDSL hydrolase family protein [Actinomycetota bacterium]